MHFDTATVLGARHAAIATPSQDFGFEGRGPSNAYWGVVSDGCSQAGRTDLGSRMWALAAAGLLKTEHAPLEDAMQFEAAVLKAAAPLMAPLEPRDTFATLGVLWARENQVRIWLAGDGYVLARRMDGRFTLTCIEYTAQAPFYLSYLQQPGLTTRWKNETQGQVRRVVTNVFDADGELETLESVDQTEDLDKPWTWQANVDGDELAYVLLTTDGLGGAGKGLYQTARELAAVKSSEGEFLQRRLGKLARAWARDDTMPSDDLTITGAWLTPYPAKEEGPANG